MKILNKIKTFGLFSIVTDNHHGTRTQHNIYEAPQYDLSNQSKNANRRFVRISDHIHGQGRKSEIAKALTKLPVNQYEASDSKTKEKIFDLLHQHKSNWHSGFLWQTFFNSVALVGSTLITVYLTSKDGVGFIDFMANIWNLAKLCFNKDLLKSINIEDIKDVNNNNDTQKKKEKKEDKIQLIKVLSVIGNLETNKDNFSQIELNKAIEKAKENLTTFLLPLGIFPVLNIIGIVFFSNQRIFDAKNIFINSLFLLSPGIISALVAHNQKLDEVLPTTSIMLSYSTILWLCNMMRWYFAFYRRYNASVIALSDTLKYNAVFYNNQQQELVLESSSNGPTDHLLGRNSAEKLLNAIIV